MISNNNQLRGADIINESDKNTPEIEKFYKGRNSKFQKYRTERSLSPEENDIKSEV